MSQDEILQKLFEEVKFRILSLQTGATFNLIQQTITECMNEMQYVIVPKNIEAASNSSIDFERVIEQNIFGEDASQTFTINGQMIIAQLASEGWLVIPPM